MLSSYGEQLCTAGLAAITHNDCIHFQDQLQTYQLCALSHLDLSNNHGASLENATDRHVSDIRVRTYALYIG